MTATEQMAVAVMVIKVADLSYITKGQEYALPWVERCLDEFCNQGEEEAALGLPVGYDRKTLDKPKSQVMPCTLAPSRTLAPSHILARSITHPPTAPLQVGFYAFMVRPMYECLDLLAAIPSQLTALQRLTDYWSEQIGKK